MESKRKLFLQLLFLFAVMGITMICVFRGEDLSQVLCYIRQADPVYLVPAVLLVLLFIWGESSIIQLMLRSFGERIPAGRCYLYSCIGFFFSCITPSATGGQPAQIYYMKKDRIPVPVSTVILMIVTILYKMVLVVIGSGVMLLRVFGRMERIIPVEGWCLLGLALNIGCVTLMCFLVFHPSLARRMLLALLGLAERLHLMKRKPERREHLQEAMELYQETAGYLKQHGRVVLLSFVITLLQRITLFFVTSLTYLAFGLRGESLLELLILQAMISVAVDMLPLPGGMGISEKLFLTLFLPVFGAELTLPAMLVSRGISYYGQLFISAVLTGWAGLRIGKSGRKSE